MRLIIIFSFFLSRLSAQEPNTIIFIHHEVGFGVDSAEKAKYRLFPHIPTASFDSAYYVSKENKTIYLKYVFKGGIADSQAVSLASLQNTRLHIEKTLPFIKQAELRAKPQKALPYHSFNRMHLNIIYRGRNERTMESVFNAYDLAGFRNPRSLGGLFGPYIMDQPPRLTSIGTIGMSTFFAPGKRFRVGAEFYGTQIHISGIKETKDYWFYAEQLLKIKSYEIKGAYVLKPYVPNHLNLGIEFSVETGIIMNEIVINSTLKGYSFVQIEMKEEKNSSSEKSWGASVSPRTDLHLTKWLSVFLLLRGQVCKEMTIGDQILVPEKSKPIEIPAQKIYFNSIRLAFGVSFHIGESQSN